MPDRAMEVRHLGEAERHIAQAEVRVGRLEALIARARARGTCTREAEESLAVMIEVLTTMKACREAIIRTIHDIDVGESRRASRRVVSER
jgi:hypothetical protein